MKNSVEKAKRIYAEIPELDLHYYGMKGYGIRDNKIKEGRPKFHLIDQDKLFSVVTLISSEDSPYAIHKDQLTYKEKTLPFRVKFIGRNNYPRTYFFYRSIRNWIPTLDSETILSLNFQPVCKGCDWCSRCDESGEILKNINPEEGVEILNSRGVNFAEIDKLTFVTGMYRDGGEVVNNILKTVELIKKQGFRGRVLYIGSQIKDPSSVRRLIEGLENTPLKYAYTLETFTQREKMHVKKNGSLEKILFTLERLKQTGIKELEYSYMPGLDPLKDFNKWMPKFSKLARPHLSIFRSAEEEHENLKTPEFLEDPISYLCSIRLAFEKEHGSPIYQNNLASLWGFPISRINPLFLTDKTSL